MGEKKRLYILAELLIGILYIYLIVKSPKLVNLLDVFRPFSDCNYLPLNVFRFSDTVGIQVNLHRTEQNPLAFSGSHKIHIPSPLTPGFMLIECTTVRANEPEHLTFKFLDSSDYLTSFS